MGVMIKNKAADSGAGALHADLCPRRCAGAQNETIMPHLSLTTRSIVLLFQHLLERVCVTKGNNRSIIYL
jgi:hypothetical protein